MTNKLKYFVANWKMHGDLSSFKIIKSIDQFLNRNKRLKKNKYIFCVPNTLIDFFSNKLKKSSILIGAQNCHFIENHGPFTGSVSANMLKKIGAEYVIIGHSENRILGDSHKILKQKIISAVKQNLNVIFCIGETFIQKKQKKTFSILRQQINQSLKKNLDFKKIIIAYEPIWSIGSGQTPSILEIKNNIDFIKKYTKSKFRLKNSTKVLYGGSVNSSNISTLSKIESVNGYLIGGASLSSKKFIDILKKCYK